MKKGFKTEIQHICNMLSWMTYKSIAFELGISTGKLLKLRKGDCATDDYTLNKLKEMLPKPSDF